MSFRALRNLVSLTILLTAPTTYAGGSGGDCLPITMTPFVITEPGRYCLMGDLKANMASGRAIWIKSDDVVVDFGHHTLSNFVGRIGNSATGIFASGRDNVKISNGKLSGWGTGITLVGRMSMGNKISSMRFDMIRRTAIDAEGTDLRIFKNQFTRIGGSSAVDDAIAISISGISPRITQNIFRDVMASGGNGNAYGAWLRETKNPVIQDNTFDTIGGIGLGTGFGLKLDSVTNALLVNNYFQTADTGISADGASDGLVRDTLTSEVNSPVVGFNLTFVGHNF